MQEIWKEIEQFPKYKISNYGNLKYKNEIQELKVNDNGFNYFIFNEKNLIFLIHRLVYIYFGINKPDDMENYIVYHKSGKNNHINNLRISGYSEYLKRWRNGEFVEKKEYTTTKLNKQNIIEIRKLLGKGILTQANIGKKFGVSQGTISMIKLNKNKRYY